MQIMKKTSQNPKSQLPGVPYMHYKIGQMYNTKLLQFHHAILLIYTVWSNAQICIIFSYKVVLTQSTHIFT